jgi:hypothetical protein
MGEVTADSTQAAALEYLECGWSVIPLRPNEKRPLGKWTDAMNQPATADQVRDWFRENPSINIGIVTGPISGLLVLDIDSDHGGNESARDLMQAIGGRPDTAMVKTPRGYHMYFKWPAGHEVHNTAGALGEGLDIRGWHGYVVAPPSHVVYMTEPTDGSNPVKQSEGDYRWLK